MATWNQAAKGNILTADPNNFTSEASNYKKFLSEVRPSVYLTWFILHTLNKTPTDC